VFGVVIVAAVMVSSWGVCRVWCRERGDEDSSTPSRRAHPDLGREARMRTCVPKISSISPRVKPFFELRHRDALDTLERMCRKLPRIG
jgi:hypothetical protein